MLPSPVFSSSHVHHVDPVTRTGGLWLHPSFSAPVSREVFRCETCSQSFRNKEQLEIHIEDHIPVRHLPLL